MTSRCWPQDEANQDEANHSHMTTSFHDGIRGAVVATDSLGAAVGSDSSGAASASTAAVTDNDDAREGSSPGPQLRGQQEAQRLHNQGEPPQQVSTRPPETSFAVAPVVEDPAVSDSAGYNVDVVNCRGLGSPAASGEELGSGELPGDLRQTSVGWRGSDNSLCSYPQVPQALPFFTPGLQLQSPTPQRTQNWIMDYCAQPMCTVLACDPWDGERRGGFQEKKRASEMFPMAGSSSYITASTAATAVVPVAQSSSDLDKNTMKTKLVDSITTLAHGQPASKQQQHQQRQQRQGKYNSPTLIMRVDGRCNNNKPSNTGSTSDAISTSIGGGGRVETGGKEFFENPTQQVSGTEMKLFEQQMVRQPRPDRESHRPAANIDPSTLFAIKFGETRNDSLASSARRNLSTKRRSPYRCGKCGQLKSNHTCPYKKASQDAPDHRRIHRPSSLPQQPSASQAVGFLHPPTPFLKNAFPEYHKKAHIARRHVEALIRRENDLKRQQSVMSDGSTSHGGSTWMTDTKKRKAGIKIQTESVTVVTNDTGPDKRNASLLVPLSHEVSDLGVHGRSYANGPDWPTKWIGAIGLADFTPNSMENEWAGASQKAGQMVNGMASPCVGQVQESGDRNSLTMADHSGRISDGRDSRANKYIGESKVDSSLIFSTPHQGFPSPLPPAQDMPPYQNTRQWKHNIETGATAAEETVTGGNPCAASGAESEAGLASVTVDTTAPKGLTLPPRMESIENMLYGKGFQPSAANAAAVAAAASAAASAAAAAAAAAVRLRRGDMTGSPI